MLISFVSLKPGHEYTKGNVKFAVSVIQDEAIKRLQDLATKNKETQGKSTIGDEKVMCNNLPAFNYPSSQSVDV